MACYNNNNTSCSTCNSCSACNGGNVLGNDLWIWLIVIAIVALAAGIVSTFVFYQKKD